ncbi:41962_t:CDS:2 [Gigaspora margarita]|uniref:41962_t:CDS:1 n=1 Tax=Gigaspora margarita TaxID=4874 RepID=A0ABM8W3I8_GIGMA|nr:41962_t:CDS:2 [Gigaspora margarita]
MSIMDYDYNIHPLSSTISKKYEICPNAAAQKASYEKIKTARNKITKFKSLHNIVSDTSIRSNLAIRIQEQKDIVRTNDKRIKMIAKKQKQLEEEGIVEQWEDTRRLSILAQNPDLLEHIHNCIEYGEADKKRRKIIIKIRTIKHLKDKLEEKYNLYISRQTLLTYLWPKHPNTFAVKRHHHLALVQIQSVSWNKKLDHPDSHYCLASVKSAKPDLISITNSEDYDKVIRIEEKIKPLWVLLVDSKPDENPKHLKNIIEYCKLFRFLDLDYLTVHTYTPGQSSFNPMKRGMAPLSSKLAGIILSIDHYSTHLNSQGKVINEELQKKIFVSQI